MVREEESFTALVSPPPGRPLTRILCRPSVLSSTTRVCHTTTFRNPCHGMRAERRSASSTPPTRSLSTAEEGVSVVPVMKSNPRIRRFERED